MKLPFIVPAILTTGAAFLLSSCASAVFYASNGKGAEVGALIPGLLSKQVAKNAKLKTRSGVEMSVEAYASRQPDPAVTGAAKDIAIFGKAAPILREVVQGENAIQLKGVKDPNIIPKNPNIIPVDPQFVPPAR